MKLKANTDITVNKTRIRAGAEFEATDSQVELLLSYGWADKVVEEVKAPKAKTPAKKTTKKK